MSIVQKVMQTVVRYVPDRVIHDLGDVNPVIEQPRYVGQPLQRVDGPAKVTGEATFAAEHKVNNLAYAGLVCSTIAKGRIAAIDTSEAERAPGVIGVVTHENNPRLARPPLLEVQHLDRGLAASDLPVMQDAEVHWDGEPVAVVVAETLEQAEHAATLVRVRYDAEAPQVSFDNLKAKAEVPPDVLEEDPEVSTGDAEKALAEAAVRVDNVYRTPRHNHNAIEPHATIAAWDDDGALTVFDSTQFVSGYQHVLATMFDLAPEKVRVICPFAGGAFGGKWAIWNHTPLCAAAAKVVGRPVKLVLSREDVFRVVGGRTVSEQRVALGANEEGRLTALIHTGTTATTTHAQYPEHFSLAPRHLWPAENMQISQSVVNLDMVANTWMRAPGDMIATFALESAIDELAHELRIDPIELRRINEPDKDPTTGAEFSSRNLVEAYERGAERFGWSERNPEPRSQRDGQWLIGRGVATAYYPVFRFPGAARVRVSSDGTALVQVAANEMGMGTATAQIQHAADRLGLPIDKVSFEYGDSTLPSGQFSAGGSSQTASVAAAVQAAVDKLHKELAKLTDDEDELTRRNDRSATYASIVRRAGHDFVEAEDSSGQAMEILKYSMASYGAQFCELRVNEETGELHVTRWLGSFDCGRIINPTTAISQFRGGIVMGIGAALTEETVFDERRGRIMNPSLAEYHVPVHLDIPHIDVIYTDIPDEHSPLGARGVGEIGITGAAAAVANAVFNATGKRIRELPITLDKLL
jgi:xanthine dehydrogenase YagR molybdenum-binding subunit